MACCTIMGIVRRDWVLDAIERLGQAIARILGMVSERNYDQALAAIDVAEQELLGSDRMRLLDADASTAAVLMRGPERVRGWALLQAERATVLAALGRTPDARVAARRAQILYTAAERRGAELSEVDRGAREEIRKLLAEQ